MLNPLAGKKSPTLPFPTSPLISICSHLPPTPSLLLCAVSFAIAVVSVKLVPLEAIALHSLHGTLAGCANVQASCFTMLQKAFLSNNPKNKKQNIRFNAHENNFIHSSTTFWEMLFNNLIYLHLKKKVRPKRILHFVLWCYELFEMEIATADFSVFQMLQLMFWAASKLNSGCILLLCNVQTCQVTS